MPRTKPTLPPIPLNAQLHDRAEAAKLLLQQAGDGWSYDSLTRLIESDWAAYEGYIWCNRAGASARNRKLKIYIPNVIAWLRLPAHRR